jgi:GGDEF domain-containing protein
LQGSDKVGVSAGIAPVEKLSEAMAALDQALSAADAALYEAKRSGSGCLMMASTADKLAWQFGA